MKTILIMTVSAILLASCAGNQVARRWAELPVSPHTDAAQMAAQIKANPASWQAAADFLSREDLASLACGRYDLLPDGTYANIQEYTTKDTSRYEAHRAYIDVQVVLSGHEVIYVAAPESLHHVLEEYDPARDIIFYESEGRGKPVPADPQNWLVLFPSDAHMPCMTDGVASDIRKVVIKVPFKEL